MKRLLSGHPLRSRATQGMGCGTGLVSWNGCTSHAAAADHPHCRDTETQQHQGRPPPEVGDVVAEVPERRRRTGPDSVIGVEALGHTSKSLL